LVEGSGARAAVITVGDELLLGQTVDTNASWLSTAISDLGMPVVRRWTVGDVDAHIREALGAALQKADVVVLSGGLGPTDDDRTRDAVAAHLGRALHEDEGWMDSLRERFARHGMGTLPETNRRQSRVPEGAELLPNAKGTAPGLLLETQGRYVVLLPGVPRELKALFADEVRPRLLDKLSDRLRPATERRIPTTGIAESALADRVEAALDEARDADPTLVKSPVESASIRTCGGWSSFSASVA